MCPIESPKTALSRGFVYSPIRDEKENAKFKQKSLNLFDKSNIAIPLSYWLVGFLSSFIGTPLSVYLVETLDAEPEQQNTIDVLRYIPWSFKLLYGFVSDVFPMGGLRRKPYFIIGYCLNSFCYIYLGIIGTPEFTILSTMLFVATIGQIMADVMADTLIVQRARLEEIENRGQLQATCYAIRFVGSFLGYLMGTLVYNSAEWGWGLTFREICILCGVLPISLLGTTLWNLYEAPARPQLVSEQCNNIWSTICLKAVWKPMAFVYIFNVLQVPNIAWSSYLQLSLDFEAYELGIISTAGALTSLFGILAYKKFFFHVSWRLIYVYCVAITLIFSLLQLCLIFQWNTKYFHMNDLFFALGDDVVREYIEGVQFLPICIMYLRFCPDGSEGAAYAMFTTFGNIASTSSYSLASLLSTIWDVSNDTLSANVYDGLWKLTVLTSALAPVSLIFIRLLPKNQVAQENLIKDQSRSVIGGTIFLLVLGTSLMWTVIQSFVEVVWSA